MAKLGRPGMSDELRCELWRLWKAGRSFSEIARATGHPPGSIFTIVKQTGGYVPPPRKRRVAALTLQEREEISRGLARGDSLRQLARQLGRAASTISREIARNYGKKRYRAIDADDRAWRRARRPKRCLLARHPELRTYVAARLGEDWSPEQIAGTLRKQYSAGSGMRVSHETIYKSLFVTPSRSASALPPSKIGRSRGTGKETCCWADTGLRSQPSSNAPPASRCLSS
jgi:hypothetical protein